MLTLLLTNLLYRYHEWRNRQPVVSVNLAKVNRSNAS